LKSEPAQQQEVVTTLDRALADIAGARAYNEWLFDRIRPFLGARVVDAGAGVGTFTALAADTGAEVTAVEPVPEFAAILRERFQGDAKVTVVEGTVEAVRHRSFDSIICLNVLEHIEDDRATLGEFMGQLVPGGRLLLLVPAHPGLYGGYDRAAGHVRRYSKRLLTDQLVEAGFEIETLRHVNPVGALGWLVRVRLRSSEEWPASSFSLFDRAVPVLRRLDALRLPFGLSLWAVARRVNGAAARAPR
jgi:SAM-dependent methyltransferase